MALVSGIAGASAARSVPRAWAWFDGDPQAFVGEQASGGGLWLGSTGNVNVRAHHLRLMADVGAFSFDHATTSPFALLNSYYIGTSQRTPIAIGSPDDQQDVTPLIVVGYAGQHHDVQQWMLSGKVVAAIDGQGRLRLGGVTLSTEVQNGRVMLLASVSGGRPHVIAVGAG